jgi:hypothetical protein
MEFNHMMQSNLTRTSIAKGFATGLLWLSLGAAYAVAQDTFVTPGTRMDRFTATVATDRVAFTTATELVPIPGTKVEFVQHGSQPQAVVVNFVAEWPKPSPDEIPAGSQAAGVFIFLFIDGNRVDPVSDFGGVLVHEGTASSVSNGTHGFTFVTEPIPAGTHVAEIFALDNVLGPFGQPNGTFVVQIRSTVVQHD